MTTRLREGSLRGTCQEYRFFPDTWILPTDMSDFKQQSGTEGVNIEAMRSV